VLASRVGQAPGGTATVVAACTWRVPRGSDGMRLRATIRVLGGHPTIRRTITRTIT
jgi:hypothetical protein